MPLHSCTINASLALLTQIVLCPFNLHDKSIFIKMNLVQQHAGLILLPNTKKKKDLTFHISFIHLSINLFIYIRVYPSIYLTIYNLQDWCWLTLFIYQSIYLSTYLSIYNFSECNKLWRLLRLPTSKYSILLSKILCLCSLNLY